ncbi:uncharacterized protein [Nicotiana tomentosiformis]|uniref:uncharacterized protein n=1 Tax=Nicotiana tomentosiformis TaxID=4098 RepID=UPI00388C993C
MAPQKRERTGQGANTALGMAVDHLFDDAGEHPRGEDNPRTSTLPDSTTPDLATPVPTPTEGATVPPPNIPIPPPAPASSSGISDRDLKGAIQMLTQIVASQAQSTNIAPTSSSPQGDSTSSRVNRFLRLDPPVFTGANPEEDPYDFIDEMYKTLRVMRATEMEGVELAAYHLKGVAYSWFEMWEDSWEEGSPPVRWSEFVDAFIDHFLPPETRSACAAEFKNLKQGIRSVWEYHMEFARLSKYVIHMLPTMEARVRRFVQSLSPLVINEATTTALNSDMNYGEMVAFAQAIEDRKLKNRREQEATSKARSAGNFGESFGGGRSAFREGHQGYPSLMLSLQGRSGGRFPQQRRPLCPRCGKMHSEICYMDLPICYGCVLRGHIQREYHSSHQGEGRGTAQPSSSTAATS